MTLTDKIAKAQRDDVAMQAYVMTQQALLTGRKQRHALTHVVGMSGRGAE